jgi:hypothetical protein
MTLKIPPENILDKILKLFGNERRVIFPKGTEGFFKELFRKGDRQSHYRKNIIE